METQSNLNDLRKQFEDYKNANKNQGNKRKTSEEILAKYFTPRADKETFRILPPLGKKKHIQEAYFHAVETNFSGGKKRTSKIYCPAHNEPMVPQMLNGEPVTDQNGKVVLEPVKCALCEKAKAILKTQDPSLKGIKKDDMTPAQLVIFENNKKIFMEANKWEAKKFYIVRGIDKGKQKDGVKFWRFKHNFKNQGVFDKLLPVLADYIENHQADFTDPERGSDLSITVTDGEWNKITYKQVSAITTKGPSKLHEDDLIVRQWLDDPITWREVFVPRKAPHVEPSEYLEMLAMGTDPYWDDSDPQDKKWIYPGRPDLEAKANTRTDNLDADTNKNFKQASDVTNDGVTINNVTESHVGQFVDTGTDVGQEVKNTVEVAPTTIDTVDENDQVGDTGISDLVEDGVGDGDGFDDLPF